MRRRWCCRWLYCGADTTSCYFIHCLSVEGVYCLSAAFTGKWESIGWVCIVECSFI
jgi:hypothetical protein